MVAATVAIPILRLSASARRRLRNAPGAAGTVQAVFRSAINILWHDGGLLTLQGPGPLRAPFAMSLARLPADGDVTPGAAVRRDADDLAVGGARLEAEGAASVDTAMRRRPDGPGELAGWLPHQPLPPVAPGLASPAGRSAQQRLAQGIRRRDPAAFLTGALGLIGLGEGLTPAGDDCLVGALAVLHAGAGGAVLSEPATRVGLLEAAGTRTTIVGRDFLRHALDGHFSELILRLFTARGVGRRREAVRRLAAAGGTSGADTLEGIRLAAEALSA